MHVFLSYCRDNAKLVAKLREDLLAAGEQVWWDQQILPGQDWRLAIRQAMKASYAVVLCLSKEAQARATSGIYPEALDAIDAYRQHAPGAESVEANRSPSGTEVANWKRHWYTHRAIWCKLESGQQTELRLAE